MDFARHRHGNALIDLANCGPYGRSSQLTLQERERYTYRTEEVGEMIFASRAMDNMRRRAGLNKNSIF
jgi:hypothetical protein